MPNEFYNKILEYRNAGKVYVIAELGSNYKSEQDLVNAISMAKQTGADAVKFQYFTPSELYGPESKIDPTFPLSQLKIKADAVGIDFLCSAFSPEGVVELNHLVLCFKVASSEMAHIRILDAIKKTEKPVILSTGGYFLPDILRTIKYLGDDYPVIVMHCNLSYPAKLVDLKKFQNLMQAWSGPIGYSDHTTSIDAVPYLMKSFGVCVYEKHFNPFEYTDTPDAPVSLNTQDFKVMVSYLRNDPMDATEENQARMLFVRRIVATKNISPGDVLKEGHNMGIFRVKKPDARGVSPFAIERLEGKTATAAIEQGHGISFTDVK